MQWAKDTASFVVGCNLQVTNTIHLKSSQCLIPELHRAPADLISPGEFTQYFVEEPTMAEVHMYQQITNSANFVRISSAEVGLSYPQLTTGGTIQSSV
jgi:hypothetical protein